ncbi:hypothetical protein SEMRO_2008_G310640.1 [Seminavis robusta]|uniref:Uncharacterized protein n=1 Tax=Seminavis robusta TaxID=568900 RepID=A0A9N8ESU9_9STRA|nr:hypothetical protein SEMRO_2008_G310640.1 [Seminavis robusta]|eukprot:Sro2008_g310640.1 n/a (276) ;mRNA; f:4470-5419
MTGVHKALGSSKIALQPANGTSTQAANYCKKGQQTKEEWELSKENGSNFGLNFQGEEFGEVPTPRKRTDLDDLCDAIQAGKSMSEVAQIHPASYVRNYRGLAAYQALQTTTYQHETLHGIYYWGPPGTGQYIKIWADKYACTGEINGGVVKLIHTTFIITSNYSIDYLWKDDPVMANAIKRRFKAVHMTTPYMFKEPNPTSILIEKANHIFGTVPMKPRPRHTISKPNPGLESWRKVRSQNSPPDPPEDKDEHKGDPSESKNEDKQEDENVNPQP